MRSFRLMAFSWHLLASLTVISALFSLVFLVWYPAPFAEMMSVWEVIGILVVVDLILGPSLTAVVANPNKSVSQLTRDISVIVLVQIVALAGGAGTIYASRPLYLAFDIDRFVVITRADMPSDGNEGPGVAMPGIFQRPTKAYVSTPEDVKQQLELAVGRLTGHGSLSAYRPERYRSLGQYRQVVDAAGISFDRISADLDEESGQLEPLARRYGRDNLLFYLLINSGRLGTLIVEKREGEIVGYLDRTFRRSEGA